MGRVGVRVACTRANACCRQEGGRESGPLRCDAADHDRAVALISHLPVLVGAALLQAADRGAPEALGPLARALASSGFADTTRVGGGNPDLGLWMARHNRSALLAALAEFRAALEGLETLVRAEDWPALREELVEAETLRPPFLEPPAAPR